MSCSCSFADFSKGEGCLAQIDPGDQIPLPPPFDNLDEEPFFKQLSEDAQAKYEVLDDTIALNLPKPESREEEERLVNQFLSGLRKLFNVERQLDISRAADDFTGTLCQVPDVFGCMSYL